MAWQGNNPAFPLADFKEERRAFRPLSDRAVPERTLQAPAGSIVRDKASGLQLNLGADYK
ncbi:MAG: hypothetical protein AXA67_03775 [Methylothermaceae bacteria B42]|nr:MAG: hypothetical protein AXA67_03775 [Methylothermaceae bacteria B42]